MTAKSDIQHSQISHSQALKKRHSPELRTDVDWKPLSLKNGKDGRKENVLCQGKLALGDISLSLWKRLLEMNGSRGTRRDPELTDLFIS